MDAVSVACSGVIDIKAGNGAKCTYSAGQNKVLVLTDDFKAQPRAPIGGKIHYDLPYLILRPFSAPMHPKP
jgi:hypothetical protein